MQFFIISHFFFIKVSLDIKMGLCFLEKNCHRKSEISFLPSLKAKLLFPVCDGIPCKHVKNGFGMSAGRGGQFRQKFLPSGAPIVFSLAQ